MDFLSAPSTFLVQCFRNVDSKDLGLRDLGMKFHRNDNNDNNNNNNDNYNNDNNNDNNVKQ